MKRCILAVLLACIMTFGMMPFSAEAASAVSAPEHFAAHRYNGNSDYFTFTAAAPNDLRELMDSTSGKALFSGYSKVQIDYKLDNGDWHYTNAWDSGATPNSVILQFKENVNYLAGARAGLPTLFPDDKAVFDSMKGNSDYFKTHTISFRARFAIQMNGSKEVTLSDWSSPFVYAMGDYEDPETLMSDVPILTTAKVEKNSGGEPFIVVKTGRLPGDIQDMHARTGGSVWTEIWLKRGSDADFKKVNDSFFSHEYIQFNASNYFNKQLNDYSRETYSVKIRYRVDLRSYAQSGRSDTIYSPFSNVISQNMPEWSKASPWATGELKKADDLGLIPDILKGVDMTKPITRAEFAAVAVKTYEALSGTKAIPVVNNPFTDTRDIEVLKAYNLGAVNGTSSTTFTPNALLNREQAAAMLTRVFKRVTLAGWTLADDSKFTLPYTKPASFADDAKISAYAKDSVYFMAANSIIKGTDGNKFSPRATTPAEEAKNYASATREQALLISVRMVENLK